MSEKLCNECYIKKYGMPKRMNRRGRMVEDVTQYPLYAASFIKDHKKDYTEYPYLYDCPECGKCVMSKDGRKLSKYVEYPIDKKYIDNFIYAYVVYTTPISLNEGYRVQKYSSSIYLTPDASFLKEQIASVYKLTNVSRNWNPPNTGYRSISCIFNYTIKDLILKNGTMKRKDISNMFKFPEDAIMESLKCDDKDNINICGQNRLTTGESNIVIFVQHLNLPKLDILVHALSSDNIYSTPLITKDRLDDGSFKFVLTEPSGKYIDF